ncbi:hypothetical protein [Helicobacter felis]|uniref:hypothetical protein n=1 Tax=Helicobacter felis TaxID=214 RepID=UPI0018F83F14|nr:hypothetical protein [Helicobacter felis]
MGFSMCCEDDLYEVFLKFKKGEPIEIEDKPLIERILHYYKPVILPTKEQLKILEVWDPELRANIIKSGHVYPQKEALAHTQYKIILSSHKNDFPFVNVKDDVIENNFSATLFFIEKKGIKPNNTSELYWSIANIVSFAIGISQTIKRYLKNSLQNCSLKGS